MDAIAPITNAIVVITVSHVRAFEFFHGVPLLQVPDNLKSAVSKADRYAPQINLNLCRISSSLRCRHSPGPALQASGDKAKAEVAVQIVERWILARLRHQTFFSLGGLNTAIRQLREQMNDRPLPSVPYEYAWKKA
uniref:Integrase core domain-containing protein n=1 Tax=Candidatus Kentrum sp. MB TaxID=2138164 RepID=A0A450XZX6_9GAMM|nr:MAG: hypothetical protein BECKMB1821G_GA0114241_100962 [Candidatus Kentron sp. MB]VFK34802.1 MAG: hypothetical protein BECKMB1821I_GA0114274_10856 [Candidatus Kentron sp. MB]VFK74193.1 MAG: hypothetical protein BECKMB1821H_GA0114242_100212 [Candidatus Kentron sp. MB]